MIRVVAGHAVVAEDGNPDDRKDGEDDERGAGAHELLRGRGKAATPALPRKLYESRS